MKLSIFLLAFAAVAVTSCTSAYKAGQTPDDVYFSPQRPQAEYVNAKDNDEDPGYGTGDDYYGDRYLQMKVKNRYQWSDLDDYYSNDRYTYGFGGYGGYSYYNSLYMNPWSPVSYWNYYYNPYYSSFYNPYYYSPVFFVGSKNGYYGGGSAANYVVSSRPRMANLGTYGNSLLNTNNYTNRRFDYNNNSYQNVNTSNRYNTNYRNTRTSAGSYLRNQFGNSNNNSNFNNTNNNSNFNSGSNSGGRSSSGSSAPAPSGGGSSSSGGGSAPVRRF